jgi:hypothetical protein
MGTAAAVDGAFAVKRTHVCGIDINFTFGAVGTTASRCR